MAPVTRRLPLFSPALLALHATAATTPQGLVALRAISNAALSEKELPTRLKLLNWGENETTKGPVKVGANTLASLAANQVREGFDHIALDYNHNSLPGHPNYKPDPREVAGYGAAEVIENDGLYLTGLGYTPSGVQNALNYRDLSPTPLLDKDGEVIFLHSVALCPQGAVKDLSFYSAGAAGLKSFDSTDAPPTTATTMDYRRLVCAMLDLDPDKVSDDDIAAAAHKAAGDRKDAAAEAGKKPEAMSARVDAIERELVIGNGLREGKVIPLAIRGLPVAQLRTIISQLPAGTVPIERQTAPAGTIALNAPADAAQKAVDDKIRVSLGISKEDWAKYNNV